MEEMKVRYITTLKEVRIINDPYRQEIMKIIGTSKKPLTAKEVAVKMKEPPSKVNYHVGILHKHDFIELDHTKTINGIIAKYYKMPEINLSIQLEGKNSKEKEVSAIRDMITTTFNSARDLFITQVAKGYEKEKNKKTTDNDIDKNELKDNDMMLTRRVYLTQEDIAELMDFFNKVSNRESEDGKIHSIFISTVALDQEDE